MQTASEPVACVKTNLLTCCDHTGSSYPKPICQCPLIIFLAWTEAAVTTKLSLEQSRQQIPAEWQHGADTSVFGHGSVYVHKAACFPSTVTMVSFIFAVDQVQPQFSNLSWA